MSFSYWEYKEWFANNDFVVVGSGIVGLNCAIQLKKQFPKSKVLVLEKGLLPQGASTKNAGFACFGSVSELLSDLKSHSEQEVFELVKKRWDGLQLLRKTLGDNSIDYQHHFGYELFENESFFNTCREEIPFLNNLLRPLFKEDVFNTVNNKFSFENIVSEYLVNQFEGQINTGKMMSALLQKAQSLGVQILNNILVKDYTEGLDKIDINTSVGDIQTKTLLFATNGFSKAFFKEDVIPARAQVIITKPIAKLPIKGTFHLEEGYYYFRNIDSHFFISSLRINSSISYR